MKHRGRYLEVMKRAESGPIVSESEFDMTYIAQKTSELIKKYGIKFNPDQIINHDDDLADRVFQAGLELITHSGVFCQDTRRRIVWAENEYLEGLSTAPAECTIGQGSDKVNIRARKPEVQLRPIFGGSPVAVPIQEDQFVPFLLSYAKDPIFDFLPPPPTLLSAYSVPIKGGSPWEVIAGWRESELTKQVLSAAGRPGMAVDCVSISTTAAGGISSLSYGGYRPSDRALVSMVAELKTNYDELEKVVHVTRIDGNMEAFLASIYGGFLGGYEGLVIGMVAGSIGINQNYMPTTICSSSSHPLFRSGSSPGTIWTKSLALQALTRNASVLMTAMNSTAAGPGTKYILYENVAQAIAHTVSGACLIEASLSAHGTNPGHATPLEARIAAEASIAATEMTRLEANEVIGRITKMYESSLTEENIGKPFHKLYDIDTLEPLPEWTEQYKEVKEELRGLGVRIP